MAVQTRSQAHIQALLDAERLKNASLPKKAFTYISTQLNRFYHWAIDNAKKAYGYVADKAKKASRWTAVKSKNGFEYTTNKFTGFKNFIAAVLSFNSKPAENNAAQKDDAVKVTKPTRTTRSQGKAPATITPLRNARKQAQKKNVRFVEPEVSSPRRSPRFTAMH